MRKNLQKVVEAFQHHTAKVGDAKRTCSTDGQSIFSYRMEIARRLPNGKVALLEYKKAPSQTTRSQVSALSFALRDVIDAGVQL